MHLAPGERRHLHFTLDSRTLSQVDDAGNRAVMPGSYQVYVGGAQPAAGASMQGFTITGTQPLPH
jgi:beta-glucosidase